MTRKAVISDVHGNLEAFEAVLKDMMGQRIDTVVCLGDVVGYGADPVKCLDMAVAVCPGHALKGNHEDAVLTDYELARYRPEAARSIKWTRMQLKPLDDLAGEEGGLTVQRWSYMEKLPPRLIEEGVIYVHGSPQDPVSEYLSSGDIAVLNPESVQLPLNVRSEFRKRPQVHMLWKTDAIRKLRTNFGLFERVCFNGHSHIPGINIMLGDEYNVVDTLQDDEGRVRYRVRLPEEREVVLEEVNDGYAYTFPKNLENSTYLLGPEKIIVNVGSVGQPRNGDWRPCYVVYDDQAQTIEFRRVEYDVNAAAAKIRAIGFEKLADRLFKGE